MSHARGLGLRRVTNPTGSAPPTSTVADYARFDSCAARASGRAQIVQFGALPNPPRDWPRLASVTLAVGSASADEEQHAAGSVLRPGWPDSVHTTARLPVLPT